MSLRLFGYSWMRLKRLVTIILGMVMYHVRGSDYHVIPSLKKRGGLPQSGVPPFKNFQKSLEELYSIVGDVALIHQSLHEPFTDVGFGIGFQTDPFAFGRYVVERFTRSHIEQIDPVDARYRF